MQYSVGVALRWTIFDGLATSSAHREQAAATTIARTQLSTMQRQEKADLKAAKETVQVMKTIHQASSEAMEATNLALTKMESDFKAGTATLQSILEIQTELSNAEKRVYEAYANRILAAAKYRLASGVDLYGGSSL